MPGRFSLSAPLVVWRCFRCSSCASSRARNNPMYDQQNSMPPEHILPNIVQDAFVVPDADRLEGGKPGSRPRILLLYGSLRARSYSRFLTQEAARLLHIFGAEPRIFDPAGLPLPDDAPADHPKVRELRSL